MRAMRRSMFTALGFLLLTPPLAAQRPDEIVRWRAVGPSAAVRPGATLHIELSAEIEPGWHLYALSQPKGGPRPLVVAIPAGRPFTVNARDIMAPLPTVAADPNFNLDTQFYADSVTMTVPVIAGAEARGKVELPVDVTFQACSARLCLRPFTATLTVPVTIAGRTQGKGKGRAP